MCCFAICSMAISQTTCHDRILRLVDPKIRHSQICMYSHLMYHSTLQVQTTIEISIYIYIFIYTCINRLQSPFLLALLPNKAVAPGIAALKRRIQSDLGIPASQEVFDLQILEPGKVSQTAWKIPFWQPKNRRSFLVVNEGTCRNGMRTVALLFQDLFQADLFISMFKCPFPS